MNDKPIEMDDGCDHAPDEADEEEEDYPKKSPRAKATAQPKRKPKAKAKAKAESTKEACEKSEKEDMATAEKAKPKRKPRSKATAVQDVSEKPPEAAPEETKPKRQPRSKSKAQKDDSKEPAPKKTKIESGAAEKPELSPKRAADADEHTAASKRRRSGGPTSTFAGRYKPSQEYPGLKFEAVKRVFESRVANQIKSQSRKQDLG